MNNRGKCMGIFQMQLVPRRKNATGSRFHSGTCMITMEENSNGTIIQHARSLEACRTGGIIAPVEVSDDGVSHQV